MKNKSILGIILLIPFSLITLSCNDKFDEVVPEDALSADVIFGTFSTIDATVVGIYNGMQDGGFIGGPDYVSDFLGGDAAFVGSFTTLQDIRDLNANATNATISGYWFDNFDVIRDANNVLDNLPLVNQEDVSFTNTADAANFETLRTQFLGEARFARALATFRGVNLFAQPFQVNGGASPGMPLVTAFFTGEATDFQLPRSTVNETHAFIEADLLVAIANLPETNDIRANEFAARALLSRLYLYREQWADAATQANIVINNNAGFSLAPDVNFYNTPSSEHLFRVINQADDSAFDNSFDTFYNPTSNNGRGDLTFTPELIAVFEAEPGDARFALSFEDVDAGSNPARFTTKYPNGQNLDSDPNVLRMGEVYLNRAEANFRGGTSIGATPLSDINALRTRAGLAPLTGPITLDDILLERRKELAFEGFRRMDVLRNNGSLAPVGGGAVAAAGSDFVILPLPVTELNRNPNAVQNPGY